MSADRPGPVQLLPLTGLPEVPAAGLDHLAGLLIAGAAGWGGLQDGDVVVVSSKVVSKALGLRSPVQDREHAVGEHTRRVVAERLLPTGATTRVVEAVAGPVMAAAGVDASNTGPDAGLLLLPQDPDGAARDLHRALSDGSPGPRFGVLVSDTAGRPWRDGQTDLALGAHGVRVLEDLRSDGARDHDGRALVATARAVGDELAAAADLVKGKSWGVPAALVRGLPGLVDTSGTGPGARTLVRAGAGDWFALGHREAVRAALGAPPGSPASVQVGVPSVLAEEPGERAGRAVRLALLAHPGTRVSGDQVTGYRVHDPDPVIRGRVAARLETALAGEDVAASVTAG